MITRTLIVSMLGIASVQPLMAQEQPKVVDQLPARTGAMASVSLVLPPASQAAILTSQSITGQSDAIGPVDTSPTSPNAATQASPATIGSPVAAENAPKASPNRFLSDFTVIPRGRIHYDVVNIAPPDAVARDDLGTIATVRRLRLGASGQITQTIGYKVEVDFANELFLVDGLMDWSKGNLTLQFGQFNNFQSLAEQTSSNDNSFIERAAYTDAFGFERHLGVSAEWVQGDALFQFGVFTDNLQDIEEIGADSVTVDARAVYAPIIGQTQLHLGASVHRTDLGDDGNSVRYRQRPFVNANDVRFIDTGVIQNAQSERSHGLELALIHKRFRAVAEAHWISPGLSAAPDPMFFGGSIDASLYLTDHHHRYSGGIFRATKITNPLFGGGIGAVEVSVRYDRLDLNDRGVVGGQQDGYIASLIWSPIQDMRLLLNYARLDYTDAVILAGNSRNYAVNVVGFRVQLTF